MTNAAYPKGREALLGSVDLSADDIRVLVVDLDLYAYNSAHDFLDDVPGGAQIAASGSLASKTITNGVFDAADTTIATVPTATNLGLIVYKHTGTASTSRLLFYVDTGSDIPFNSTGGGIVVSWAALGIYEVA